MDLTMIDGEYPRGARAIERLGNWLRHQNFRCLTTARVSWRGREGWLQHRQFGTKRYVLECAGNCRGLRYRPTVLPGGQPSASEHLGLSQLFPYPVIQWASPAGSYVEVQWHFGRPETGTDPPDVRLHMWTQDPFDYGAGCRFS